MKKFLLLLPLLGILSCQSKQEKTLASLKGKWAFEKSVYIDSTYQPAAIDTLTYASDSYYNITDSGFIYTKLKLEKQIVFEYDTIHFRLGDHQIILMSPYDTAHIAIKSQTDSTMVLHTSNSKGHFSSTAYFKKASVSQRHTK